MTDFYTADQNENFSTDLDIRKASLHGILGLGREPRQSGWVVQRVHWGHTGGKMSWFCGLCGFDDTDHKVKEEIENNSGVQNHFHRAEVPPSYPGNAPCPILRWSPTRSPVHMTEHPNWWYANMLVSIFNLVLSPANSIIISKRCQWGRMSWPMGDQQTESTSSLQTGRNQGLTTPMNSGLRIEMCCWRKWNKQCLSLDERISQKTPTVLPSWCVRRPF